MNHKSFLKNIVLSLAIPFIGIPEVTPKKEPVKLTEFTLIAGGHFHLENEWNRFFMKKLVYLDPKETVIVLNHMNGAKPGNPSWEDYWAIIHRYTPNNLINEYAWFELPDKGN
jgi:hypothetical protein